MVTELLRSIFHLKRVHSIVPDQCLARILKDKLVRLNLQPALLELTHLYKTHNLAGSNQPDTHTATSLSNPSSPTSSNHGPSRDTGSNGAYNVHPSSLRGEVNFIELVRSGPCRSAVPDTGAMTNLLECIAYFRIADSPIAREALQLVPYYTPSMTVQQLAHTLAACGEMGEQGIIVSTVPMLLAALQGGSWRGQRVVQAAGAGANAHEKGAALTEGSVAYSTSALSECGEPVPRQGGEGLVTLIEALHAARVKEHDIWTVLANHCVHCMESLDGDQLLRVLEVFHTRKLSHCAEFFLAAEGYIASQVERRGAAFMTDEQLQLVVEYYTELGQPVVSLLSAGVSGFSDPLLDASFSSDGLAKSSGSGARLGDGRSWGRSLACPGSDRSSRVGEGDESGTHARRVFVEGAVRAAQHADAHALRRLLYKCDHRGVMHETIMHAIAQRLVALFLRPTAAARRDGQEEEPPSPSWSLAPCAEGEEGRRVVPLLSAVFQFARPELFVRCGAALGQLLNALCPHVVRHHTDTSDSLSVSGDAAASPETAGDDASARPPVAPPHVPHAHLLALATSAVELLPRPWHPRPLIRALLAGLRYTHDILPGEVTAPRLARLVGGLFALHEYGGKSVLEHHMPALAMALANLPRRGQLELAAALAVLPRARAELLPGVLRTLTAAPHWSHTLTAREVELLVAMMQRGGVADCAVVVVAGVVSYLVAHKTRFGARALVGHLAALTRLGVRDVEFYSSVAAHVLDSRHGGAGGGERVTTHDLCVLLYSSTFVLKDVIRVVQQILSRLKVCVGQTSAEDVVLILYSVVKLGVARHMALTRPLCQRLTTMLSTAAADADRDDGSAVCTAAQLTSVWSSLRALEAMPDDLVRVTASVVTANSAAPAEEQRTERGKEGGGASHAVTRIDLNDLQYVSIVHAMVYVTARQHAREAHMQQQHTQQTPPTITPDRLHVSRDDVDNSSGAVRTGRERSCTMEGEEEEEEKKGSSRRGCEHLLRLPVEVECDFRERAMRILDAFSGSTRGAAARAQLLQRILYTLLRFTRAPLSAPQWALCAVRANELCGFFVTRMDRPVAAAPVDIAGSRTTARSTTGSHRSRIGSSRARQEEEEEATCAAAEVLWMLHQLCPQSGAGTRAHTDEDTTRHGGGGSDAARRCYVEMATQWHNRDSSPRVWGLPSQLLRHVHRSASHLLLPTASSLLHERLRESGVAAVIDQFTEFPAAPVQRSATVAAARSINEPVPVDASRPGGGAVSVTRAAALLRQHKRDNSASPEAAALRPDCPVAAAQDDRLVSVCSTNDDAPAPTRRRGRKKKETVMVDGLPSLAARAKSSPSSSRSRRVSGEATTRAARRTRSRSSPFDEVVL